MESLISNAYVPEGRFLGVQLNDPFVPDPDAAEVRRLAKIGERTGKGSLVQVIVWTDLRSFGSPASTVSETGPLAWSQVISNGFPSVMAKSVLVIIGFALTVAARMARTADAVNFILIVWRLKDL